MINKEITEKLYELQDTQYRDFQSKLIPSETPIEFIGVRTPALKKLAKELIKRVDKAEFLNSLPHRYFDENQLHAFMISEIKDFDSCIAEVEKFLPYIDNWATCDQLSPKVFKKHKDKLLAYINKWIESDKIYTVRFAVGMLMSHYLDEDFKAEYADKVSKIKSEEYYVNMMTAWYFATALAKHYDSVIGYIEDRKLSKWTHNKAIQKCVESRRITPEKKVYLKTLKIK